MERHLINRAVVHGQATQFMLRIADASHAIVNVILRSLSVNYGTELRQLRTTAVFIHKLLVNFTSNYKETASNIEFKVKLM